MGDGLIGRKFMIVPALGKRGARNKPRPIISRNTLAI
jgi:hypothetical protein